MEPTLNLKWKYGVNAAITVKIHPVCGAVPPAQVITVTEASFWLTAKNVSAAEPVLPRALMMLGIHTQMGMLTSVPSVFIGFIRD
jgi:hypothetical protein